MIDEEELFGLLADLIDDSNPNSPNMAELRKKRLQRVFKEKK